MPEAPGDLVLLPRALARAFRCLRNVPIVHFVEVAKVNRRGKRQQRFLVITPTHLFSCVENGVIQRCVPTRSVAEVHVWRGAAPQVGLKIPSEYDMLFFMNSAADVAGVVAALQPLSREGAGGGGGSDALCLVEAAEALSGAAYALERPKGLARGISHALDWSVGAVGEVPAAGMRDGVLRPFVAPSARGIFLHAPTTAAAPSSPSSAAARGVASSSGGETAQSSASQATRRLSNDYSAEDAADTPVAAASPPVSPRPPPPEPAAVEVGPRPQPAATSAMSNAANTDNGHGGGGGGGTAAAAPAGEQALREARRRVLAEREQWCLLLAAERRNTYRLRQAISDLRGQVLALSSQNLAMRTELLNQRTT
ncbi:uncharacterized protein Tco025E_00895 [Trypanosoma conorhini]|uniref:Uncharacterized protein n=1 Tax=Trypanosoma conorhini TaxID=83891 RepID=A0A3S5IUM7_9TRYP|nr:uncharacterized protein Tco025E_00895 [Trypanosoma conorhini]RNF26813.1 hypothetical protein Tco025E_00895 [Trypanosoma conorhini]